MRRASELIVAAGVALMSGIPVSSAVAVEEAETAAIAEEGKAIAFDRKKGNCLSCHMIIRLCST